MRVSGKGLPSAFRLPFVFVLTTLLGLRIIMAQELPASPLGDSAPSASSDVVPLNDSPTVADEQQKPQSQTKQTAPPAAQESKTASAGSPSAPQKETSYAAFWPSWFQMAITYRGRFEHPSGRGYTLENGDGYYLNRLRLEAALRLGRFVDVFATTQDSRVAGYDVLRTGLPGMTDALDLRQAYIDVHGQYKTGSLALRVGRQTLDYGSRRLVGVSIWANSPPVYDAAKFSFSKPSISMDAFASTRISLVYPYEPNEPRKGENLYGTYVVLRKLVPNAHVEPYLFWRTQPLVRDELNQRGDSDLVTTGLRFFGKLPYRFDYTAEAAFQRGTYAMDNISAWGGSWGLGHTFNRSAYKPRLLFEYNYASGDTQKGDGTRGTFDQLYPSNHANYGIADQVGWRNTSNYKIGFEVEPAKRLRIQFDVNDFYLATLRDALYTDSGAPVVTNPKAGSGHVGWEPDLQFTYMVNRQNTLGFGYARLNPGRFLRDSTPGHAYNFPYVYWECRY